MTNHFHPIWRLAGGLITRHRWTAAVILSVTILAGINIPVGWAEVQGLPLGQTIPTIPGSGQLPDLKAGSTITVAGGAVSLSGDSVTARFTPRQQTAVVPVVVNGVEYRVEIILVAGQPGASAGGQAAPFTSVSVRVAPLDPGTVPAVGPADLHASSQGFVFALATSGMAPLLSNQNLPIIMKVPGQGVLSRWNPASNRWEAVPSTGTGDNVTAVVNYVTADTLFRLLVADQPTGAVDFDLPGGRFFGQANGFGGAGSTGYAVTDDEAAAFWTEFNRMGGVQRVGYPVTGRFVHKGFLTQAFQKMALQWRPDLNAAVPVNVLDDLNARGVDPFLDFFRQVPSAADTAADTGLAWEQIVARHVGMLDPYPALKDFYMSDPAWLETYGLPLSVKEYGPFTTVRLQRATLQLWNESVPWAPAGSVVVGNGGDLAKEAGLWTLDATSPAQQ